MRGGPRNVAPEPYFSGMLTLLEKMLVQLRSRTGCGSLTEEESAQISALADALHNIPSSLREYRGRDDERAIHEALMHYSDLARERGWTLIRMNFERPPPPPRRASLRLVKK